MNAMDPRLWISLFVIALFAGLSVTRAQTGSLANVVTLISDLENGATFVKMGGEWKQVASHGSETN